MLQAQGRSLIDGKRYIRPYDVYIYIYLSIYLSIYLYIYIYVYIYIYIYIYVYRVCTYVKYKIEFSL